MTLLAAAAMRGVLRRFEIRESSMVPALEPGDWVIAKRATSPPERGDVVVLDDPTGTGTAGFEATGIPHETDDRIGGIIQIVGRDCCTMRRISEFGTVPGFENCRLGGET